jgi:hypothetical protein
MHSAPLPRGSSQLDLATALKQAASKQFTKL